MPLLTLQGARQIFHSKLRVQQYLFSKLFLICGKFGFFLSTFFKRKIKNDLVPELFLFFKPKKTCPINLAWPYWVSVLSPPFPPSPPGGREEENVNRLEGWCWRAGTAGPANNKMREQTLIASSSQRSDKRCALSSLLPPLVILSSHLSGGNRLSLLGVGQVEPGHDKLSDIIN